MASLRVGIDLSPLGYGNLVRGIGIYAENLLVALAEVDHTTQYFILLTNPARDVDWLSDLPDNFQRVMVPAPLLGRAAPLISHQVVLPIQIRRLGLDVLHCIDVPTNPSHPGVPWWQTVPTVVTVHDLTPLVMGRKLVTRLRHRLFYRFMLRACRRAVHLIADSNNTAHDIVRYGLAPRTSVTVVPLAAPRFSEAADVTLEPDRKRFVVAASAALGTTEVVTTGFSADAVSAPNILHVGGADPPKNQASVLKAFAMLCKDPGFSHRLVLVGTHHLGDQVAVEVEPRAAGRIIRLSGLSRSEVRRLYQGCDVFVFPSLYEGFGLPVLEAMSCGVPVVASRASAIPEVAGDAAILADPGDHIELANAVSRLISDRQLRDHYVEAGYGRVREFSWTRTAQMTREVYERVAAHNTRGRR